MAEQSPDFGNEDKPGVDATVSIEDGGGSGRLADVVLKSGLNKLAVDATVTVEEVFGQDPIADSWFRLVNTGAENDTIRIQVAATTNDPSSPDRDLPAFDKTYTTLLAEVGDEVALATRIVSDIKTDAGAGNSERTAILVKDNENAVVFVSSKKRGEFFERPNANDFQVTTTGTASVTVGFDDFITRGKATELARSKDDPRQGILGISGSVTSAAQGVDLLLEEFASDAGSVDLTVDGSVTPVEFTIDANASGDNNKIINAIKLYGDDGNIKVGESNFMGLNAALTNGILIEITKNSVTTTFRNLKSTNDFLARMASSPEKSLIIGQSGGDYIIATFDFARETCNLSLRTAQRIRSR